MGIQTKIPWCDSTLNPTIGCSEGCEVGRDCFAERLCRRFAGNNPAYPADFHRPELYLHRLAHLRRWPDLTGKKREMVLEPRKPFQFSLDPKPLIPAKPWLDGMPRLVFLSDLGEMFDEQLPSEWLARRWRDDTRQTVLEYLASLPHILIILTKQAERMHDLFKKFSCPPNLWLGVSVTNQSTLWRVDKLLKVDCKVKIISHEPATGGIDYGDRLKGIQWLISGGMSGPAPCNLTWLRSDRDQAKAAGCAWFMKQCGARPVSGYLSDCRDHGVATENGFRVGLSHPSGADPAEWPEDLQNCREVPRCPT